MRMRTLPLLASLAAISAPATAQRHPDPPAVSDAGHGAESYVLISGLVGGVAGFRRLEQRLLAHGHRVIIVDPYQISVDSADVSFAALARRVNRILDERGVVAARVVAHAHGAGVALRLAANSPERVSALYFLDVGALASNGTHVLGTAVRLAPLIAQVPGGREFIRKRYLNGLRANSSRHAWLDDTTRARYTDPLLRNTSRVVAMAVRLSQAQEPDSLERVIARVEVPVRILLGAFPHPSGPDSAEMHALAPLGARAAVARLENVGHFVHEEAPDDVARFVMKPLPITYTRRPD